MALFFGGGTAAERQSVSRGVKTGKLAKLFTGIYTDELERAPSTEKEIYSCFKQSVRVYA
jgi:hypothetical protein